MDGSFKCVCRDYRVLSSGRVRVGNNGTGDCWIEFAGYAAGCRQASRLGVRIKRSAVALACGTAQDAIDQSWVSTVGG